jgi:hypothetical protein
MVVLIRLSGLVLGGLAIDRVVSLLVLLTLLARHLRMLFVCPFVSSFVLVLVLPLLLALALALVPVLSRRCFSPIFCACASVALARLHLYRQVQVPVQQLALVVAFSLTSLPTLFLSD